MKLNRSFIIALIGSAAVAIVVALLFHWSSPKTNLHLAFWKDSGADFAMPTPTPTPDTATLIAAGDIMMSRNVAAKIKAANSFDYPFVNITDYLKSADIAFANLECPITVGPVVPSGSMIFHADPGAENGIKNAGIDIVSLANNHTPNYGAKGILDTINYLDQVGVKHAGAGADLAAADAPTYIDVNGIRFAFLAYNDVDVVPANYAAAPNHPGTNFMDISKLRQNITDVRPTADIVIVSMHSGIEYSVPDKSQMDFAHAAIDAGADLVLGHHPHVVQRMETYKGKYIFYSLGNFVFDQYFSKETSEGLTVKFTFNKQGVVSYELKPVTIGTSSQPALMTDQKAIDEVVNTVLNTSTSLKK